MQDLLPVKLAMRGAINEGLEVIGGIVVSITVGGVSGSERLARLICYVSETIIKAFFCREALTARGGGSSLLNSLMHASHPPLLPP